MGISRNGHAMSSNASYHQDVRFIFTPSRWILGSIGIWPIAFRGIGEHISRIIIVICNFVLSFAIVPCALHIIYDQKDLNIRLKLCGLLGFCSTAMMKFFVLVIRRPKIWQCIEHVKDDWWQVGVFMCKIKATKSTNRCLSRDVEKCLRLQRNVWRVKSVQVTFKWSVLFSLKSNHFSMNKNVSLFYTITILRYLIIL